MTLCPVCQRECKPRHSPYNDSLRYLCQSCLALHHDMSLADVGVPPRDPRSFDPLRKVTTK